MATVLKKETLYQALFFLCVAIPYLNNYELTFSIWSAAVLLTVQKKYSFTLIRYLLYFVAIFCLALLSSFFYEVQPYEYARDIAYMLKPILGLLVGYQVCKDYIKQPIRFLVNAGILIGIMHLCVVGYTVVFYHVRSLPILRMHAGYFSDFEVYSLIVLLFHKRFNLQVSRNHFRIGIAILSLSIFMYFARTNYIQLVILYTAMKGYLMRNKQSMAILTSVILFIAVGYSAIYIYNPSRNKRGFEEFLYKIKNSPIEPFKTKVDVTDWKDFNDNYRSYENILTIKQVKQKGTAATIFGQGMGSSIDLKKKVWLQSSFMRYIPFLHNGFMTILLKAGVLGDIILVFSILFLLKDMRSSIPLVQNINYLLIGTGIFLIFSYWVFMGFYFTVDTKAIIVGFLFRYRHNIITNNIL